ncbi:hypothetical protein BH10PLA1_BH10PLA1_08390 [soil metagenome]
MSEFAAGKKGILERNRDSAASPSQSGGIAIPPYGDDRELFQRKTVLLLLLALLTFGAISAWAAVASDGFVEADGCTHYLYARFAIDHPYLMVNIWARPLITCLNALPAYYGGRLGVRFTSLAVGLICAIATYRIAVNQKYRLPIIAAIFLFAQPLFFIHSFSELTELPFAMVVILAFWAYQKRMWMVMTVLISITPLGRPEGFGFLLAAAFTLLCHRKWWWVPVLAVPLVLWSWVGWVAYGLPGDMKWYQWLIRNWPYEATSVYGRGPIYHYIGYLPSIVGPLLLPAAAFGVWWCLKYGKMFGAFTIPGLGAAPSVEETPDALHRRRCDFVIAALPVGILLVHSVFWFFGKFSGGELRYMLVVGPFWALTAARGWEYFCRRASAKITILTAIALTALPASVNLAYSFVPVSYVRPELIAQKITVWYQNDAQAQQLFPRVLSPEPAFYYMMDLCPSGDPKVVTWLRSAVENPPPGTLMVMEPILATFNSDKRMVLEPDSIARGGWVKFKDFEDGWSIYLSPKDAAGHDVTAASLATSP